MSLYKSECEIKVSFEDLDPMNVVWHGNYMRFMEQARCDMFDKLNYTYMDMKEDGFAYPIAKMKVKYIRPAMFGDILTVKLSINSIEPTLNIDYKILNKATGDKIFEATTMQIAVDICSRESFYTAPHQIVNALREANGEKD